jgi:Na+/H+ antiporter NhaD/arsenite permease-like protein
MEQTAFVLLIFAGVYSWLATGKTPRYVVALCGAGALVVGKIFTLEEALAQVNWQTIALIFGMFTIVAALSESGFFNWLALAVVRRLKYNPIKVFIVFPLLAAFLSMFLDNITVMLFLAALTLELCAYIPIDPVILITAEVCAANTGGGATLVGAPPNLVMGTALGYSFNSFLIHMAPSVWICTFVLMAVYFAIHQKYLSGIQVHNRPELEAIVLHEKVTDPALLKAGLLALTGAMLLLLTHHLFESRLQIPLSVGMAALIPALLLMVYENRHGRDVMRKIDLESLFFFIGLFVIVGALNKVGAFRSFAELLLTHLHNPVVIMITFLWFAAIASAFVDNVPMALSMAYLIKEMKGMPGAPPEGIMVWASLIGLLMGGNMTPIGGSPNVVAYGILEKAKIKVGWARWAKLTVPATLTALVVASFLMWVKFNMGWY